jgi:hypothetical protein
MPRTRRPTGCRSVAPRVGEEAQLREEHVVVAEDDVVLAAELTEEGRPGDPRGLRDLLDRGRFEALRGEQVERRGDDGVAGGGRSASVMPVSLTRGLRAAACPRAALSARSDHTGTY